MRLLAIAALLLVVAYIGVTSTARNEGEFTYALDDTYIHLAVAKNLATEGTWGINPGTFSPCTSSIAWPILLALLGAAATWGMWIPLALNLLLAALVLWVADSWMEELRVGWMIRAGVLVGFVLVVPLGVLAILGLEHVAQICSRCSSCAGDCGGRMAWRRNGSGCCSRWSWSRSASRASSSSPALRGCCAPNTAATRAPGCFWRDWCPSSRSACVSLALGARFFPTPIWMKGKLASELLPSLRSGGNDPDDVGAVPPRLRDHRAGAQPRRGGCAGVAGPDRVGAPRVVAYPWRAADRSFGRYSRSPGCTLSSRARAG